MFKVVQLIGLQPTEKLVGLATLNVGHADNEVTVTVFCVEQPLTRLVVTNVYVPGGMLPDKTLIVLLDVAIGTPPGKGLSGLYQSC